MTENDAAAQVDANKTQALPIEEAIEKILEQNKDHAALLRTTIRDNILVSRTAQKMVDEYSQFRNEVAAAARTGTGPIIFTLRRLLMQSEQRLAKFFTSPEPQVIRPTQPEAKS